MPVESVMEHERIWIEGLNRGDVSAADAAFAPDCVVHITGVPEPVALDGLIVDRVAAGKVAERWEQWDQSLMLQQLGFA